MARGLRVPRTAMGIENRNQLSNMQAGRSHPQSEEEDMKRIRMLREIAVPAAIVVCFAGLSAFTHYAGAVLARAT